MLNSNHAAEVAQLVEQPIRNRQVDGSNPPLGSTFLSLNRASAMTTEVNSASTKIRSRKNPKGAAPSGLNVLRGEMRQVVSSQDQHWSISFHAKRRTDHPPMIMSLGPVSDAAHGGSLNPWFTIGSGVFFLSGAWVRYFKLRKTTDVPIAAVLAISAIGGAFIFLGVWQWLK